MKLDAGHFIAGRHNAVLFDERNIHIQCKTCNAFLEGNRLEYNRFMLKKYGQEVINDLERRDKEVIQFKVFELLDWQEYFRKKIEVMEKELGINLIPKDLMTRNNIKNQIHHLLHQR